MSSNLLKAPALRRRADESRDLLEGAGRDLLRWADENRDLALLSGLLVLTAAFGRPFSKLGAGGVYVTEVAVAAIAALALLRTGLRGAADRVRATVPLVPLGLFWLAGAIAGLRGVAGHGLGSTLKDVGLVEYSIFVPLVAVVVDTRARADTMLRVLSYAGLAATAVFALVFFFAPDTPIGVVDNPTSAVGIYLALYVLPVVARLVYGRRPATWELATAAGAVLLMAFGAGRSVLVALVAALVVLVALSPRPARAAAIGVTGIALSLLAVVGLQTVGFGERGLQREVPRQPVSVTVGSSLVLDDALDPAVGGTVVEGYAAKGDYSREAGVNEAIEIPFVKGLVKGETYTVSFSVLPLDPTSTRGIVGNNAATGWSMVFWHVSPDRTWQRVVARLTATGPTERLMFAPDVGVLGARFDAVRIMRGVSGPPPGDALDRESRVSGPVPDTRTPPKDSSLLSALVDSFNPDSTAGEFQNANWRLDYWGYLVRKALHEPAFGVGYGRPAAFAWHDHVYDTRDAGPEAVSPPHNSFVNVLYRMGFLGLASLAALIAIAAVGMLRLVRATPLDARPPLVALVALAAFIVAIAFLNVALEGPYMAMFFWTVLGLMFVLPALSARAGSRTGPSAD